MRCVDNARDTMPSRAMQKNIATMSSPSPASLSASVAVCRGVARLVEACRAVSRPDALENAGNSQLQAKARARMTAREGRTNTQRASGRGLRVARQATCAAVVRGLHAALSAPAFPKGDHERT